MFLNRKIKIIDVIFWAAITVSPSSLAKPPASGQVNMRGALLDAACSIELGDAGQSINFEKILKSDGLQSSNIVIDIQLTDCVLKRDYAAVVNWNKFKVTFDGLSDGTLFGLEGSSSGAAYKIKDENGRPVIPGQALPLGSMQHGDMDLNYIMKLSRDSHQPQVNSGDYLSTLKLKMDYF